MFHYLFHLTRTFWSLPEKSTPPGADVCLGNLRSTRPSAVSVLKRPVTQKKPLFEQD